MQRVTAYVDGYNLYHGLHAKGWKRFYWLNIPALVRRLLKPDQTLVVTKYFTTIVIGHNELSKSLFPDTIIKPNGVALRRPALWR